MISCQYFLCHNAVTIELKHKDDIFALPEIQYDVAT